MLYDRGTGWCDWEFSNFRDRISYINDFPFNVVEALIRYFETGETQSVDFDAEGWVYTFVFSSNVTVADIVLYGDIHDFANDFISELEGSLESWAHFPSRREDYKDYKELADEIAKLRLELMDDDELTKWVQIIS